MRFNEMLKHFRIESGLTLRACSAKMEFDPSNWSKLERGVTPAPKDEEMILKWAKFLKIRGQTRRDFLDQAALSRNEIPSDVASDAKAIAALPLFFRAVREDQLKALLEDVRASHSP